MTFTAARHQGAMQMLGSISQLSLYFEADEEVIMLLILILK